MLLLLTSNTRPLVGGLGFCKRQNLKVSGDQGSSPSAVALGKSLFPLGHDYFWKMRAWARSSSGSSSSEDLQLSGSNCLVRTLGNAFLAVVLLAAGALPGSACKGTQAAALSSGASWELQNPS